MAGSAARIPATVARNSPGLAFTAKAAGGAVTGGAADGGGGGVGVGGLAEAHMGGVGAEGAGRLGMPGAVAAVVGVVMVARCFLSVRACQRAAM
ncbi:hypothetical protein GCM10009839_46450 [Catenulispora yoronensis]|uniref:Uncharacterized protein n=1 Tax=Catenulispora yoronensis TaxID=450799 RepID=A0ABP5G3Q3_9ACTN